MKQEDYEEMLRLEEKLNQVDLTAEEYNRLVALQMEWVANNVTPPN